jgi:FG-GAP-like repeat/FG-GAP repeat
MSFLRWLQNLRSALTLGRGQRHHRRRGSLRATTHRPYLEALEDRLTPSFAAPVSYVIDGTPEAVVTADFNGDGRLDLAVAHTSSNSAWDAGAIGILLGNGDGTLQPAQNFATGVTPVSVAVGDFNEDGKLDLVTANVDDNSVSVLLGNGDGTMQAPLSIALGSSLQSMAVGDFNGDGKMDIAVTSNVYGVVGYDGWYGYPIYGYEGYANVLFSHGDGSFTGPVVNDLGVGFRTSAVAADFNGDGRADLAVNGGYGTISVELSDPSGYFVPAGSVYVPSSDAMTAGDVNGDGHIDVVTGTSSNVAVLLGDGTGDFGSVQNYAAGYFPAGIALADFNHDGHADIATANYGEGTVSVLLGRGNGAFAPPSNYVTGTNPLALAAGDFNADGFPDLAVANGNVSVLLNTGDWPSFQVSGFPATTTAGVAQTFTVTALDANGNPSPSYTGTVHFTSTDQQAGLPADYTFTAADHGTHTFTVTLKTAGTQAISVGDDAAGATGDQTGIMVNAAAASTMTVSFAYGLTAGYSYNYLAVALRDAYGNVASGYRGTIHFTSSDPKAVLPANYTFTAADAGVHDYFSATLKTAGTQSITATDTAMSSLTATRDGINVYAAQASRLLISVPSSVTAGVPFSLTVTVTDAYGNVITGYTGTIYFSSTDSRATLPSSYTFTAADKGKHTFTGLILQKNGKQTITITDGGFYSLYASVIVQVAPKKK